ncbi:hypothetical protein J6590_071388 [Homalodisca vitripennis]|nr:hypothetical protein J6590_071388 [Homalodisca vitripennis]
MSKYSDVISYQTYRRTARPHQERPGTEAASVGDDSEDRIERYRSPAVPNLETAYPPSLPPPHRVGARGGERGFLACRSQAQCVNTRLVAARASGLRTNEVSPREVTDNQYKRGHAPLSQSLTANCVFNEAVRSRMKSSKYFRALNHKEVGPADVPVELTTLCDTLGLGWCSGVERQYSITMAHQRPLSDWSCCFAAAASMRLTLIRYFRLSIYLFDTTCQPASMPLKYRKEESIENWYRKKSNRFGSLCRKIGSYFLGIIA